MERVPDWNADEMVQKLFEDGNPDRWDSILYPGSGEGELYDAVERYCEAKGMAADPPSGTAVDIDEERLIELDERSGDGLRTINTDFLAQDVPLEEPFDYVICNPPTISWTELSEEDQRAYAANFDRIIPADERIDQDVLFLEQAIRHLDDDGRGVFFTSADLTDSAGASSFRDYHYYHFEDVEVYTPDDHSDLESEYVVTVVSMQGSADVVRPIRYDATEYEEMLADRVDTDRPFIAAAIMTSSPEGFGPEQGISDVFFELQAKDYEAAPVYRKPEESTGFEGFVSRESIRTNDGETVADQLMELDAQHRLSPEDHLREVIDSLAEERFQFVAAEDEVRGIITRFDLNREPMYLHLFDCFSDFEIGLRKLIRREAPDWDDRVDVHIGPRPGEQLYTDRLACGKLGKLIDIVDSLGLEREIQADLTGYETTLEDLKILRDTIAHYNPIIHTMGGGPTSDSIKRGARQLRREYHFLNICTEGLVE